MTIGTFDGVHRGHQALVRQALARGRELGLPVAAITFEPVPAQVLRPELFPGRICSPETKLARLAELGIDEILTITFDRELAQQTPEEFMAEVAATGLIELWVGEAFALGKNRSGNVDRLREIGGELGFRVVAVNRIADDHQVISSSAIRKAILDGDVARAMESLGRPYRISGEVIHGAHLGRTIGFPTANVVPPAEMVPLADGIYASLATLPGESAGRAAMTYVGTRPTVNSGDRLIETNVLDYDGDLYGQTIAVDLMHRLRGDRVFSGIEALIAQLHADEMATRAYFAERSNDVAAD
ncbi:MAG: riboflavin biosynthesis protein RibF [Thermomicrobiales bacterium]|nr:riboflavin biosynthesis protein RibF [Thermomicrobiales bacterium]